ncbi:protein UPSTREAM OF FLC-like [Chenopodium quinoa]|uniref:protein UPSTREAM OF FLC-like n=1 Tax=Chenopodium quinoa TaxID=63459 RepID=UPI000B7906C2|nr:protein UPSTREAM OF FLC-like [Chenopodium quinoa]
MDKVEVGRVGRSSTSERLLEVNSISPTPDSAKLTSSARKSCHKKVQQHLQHEQHPKNRGLKMFSKVQVVYYLTRNGQLEHPHYMEVSHLATQPLRLKDVVDRLAVLRGKAMPSQYSWSCKRSYKNGYVWNDLTENDVIYASEGSEYVLKGSELVQEKDYSEIRLEELQIKRRQQRQGSHIKTNGLVMNKSGGTHEGQNYRQVVPKHQEQKAVKNYEQTENNDDDDEEEEDDEEKGSCNSSNAPYPAMEQEESYSLPSTSSTNSDKLPPPPTQVAKTTASESKRYEKETARIIEEDGEPAVSTSLTRNSTVLLQLIACGGGGIAAPQDKAKDKPKPNVGSNRNFNFSMKNSFMPCLKQQLSTRAVSTSNKAIPLRVKAGVVGDERQPCSNNQDVTMECEDEDMMMVRYMSENPRFGNLQSEEKEYFSGTIVEAMSTHHQHTHSSGSASSYPHPPVFTKSSSYNEQRSYKAGLQAEAAAASVADIDDEKEDAKVKGFIKLCIPRKKSFSSTSTKHNV